VSCPPCRGVSDVLEKQKNARQRDCYSGFKFFTPTSGAHFFWEKLPVFYALFGFFGCIVLIIVTKALGKFFIKRDENYYE
jgi:hypothetical protein